MREIFKFAHLLIIDVVAVSVSENGSRSDEHLQISPNQDRHNKKWYAQVY